MPFLKYYLSLISLFILSAAYGQYKKINNTTQNWSEVDLLGQMSKKWKWQTDFQYSRQSPYEDASFLKHSEQLAIRLWMHYYPIPTIKVSAFAGWWYSYPIAEVGAREFPEYRAALQTQFYKFFGSNLITNRVRAEFREIQDWNNTLETVFRGRYMLRYQRLLNHETYDKNSSYAILSDELFINSGSMVTGYKLFDQNRIFIGWGYYLTNNISFEVGYFNQFIHHTLNANFDSNHILQISLIFDNLTK